MATITYSKSILDFDDGLWYGWASGNSSKITITDGYHKEVFTGRFSYDYWGESVTGGVVTGYTYSEGGKNLLTITGASLSAVTVYSYYMGNQDLEDLAPYIFGANDTINGSSYDDFLSGYAGNDRIYGNAGSDFLLGDIGDDFLDGGVGADTMMGGLGNDTYVIDNLADVIVENAGEGIDLVNVAIATANGSYTLGANLENATLTNTVAYTLIGNGANNLLIGNKAANRIDGGLGADRMEGGAGNDTYVVDNVGDVVVDSAGIDTIEASVSYTLGTGVENLVLTGSTAISGTGNALANILDGSQNSAANILSGLGGNDTYIVGLGDSVVETDAKGGIDLVRSAFDFTLGDYLENLTLTGTDSIDGTGNALANVLTGNDGDNVLDGKAGVDTLLGGKGNDTYIVDLNSKNALEDKLTEKAGEGIDSIVLRGGNAAVAKAVTITLGANIENLDASQTGDVKLNLTGNALDNVLVGNAAKNVFTGGAGSDTFKFGNLADMGATSATWDVITDFKSGIDKIDLSGLDANTATPAHDAFQLLAANTEFSGAGQLKFLDGVLYGNVSGGTEADFAIQLTGVKAVALSDFIV